MDGLITLWSETGIAHFELGQICMIAVGCVLLFLAISKGFEPLLLLPIGFGAILANIPNAGFTEPGGLLYYVYYIGIESGVFPLLIFMGVGAMTDFGALIANPKTLWLGPDLLGAIAVAAYSYMALVPIIQPPIMKALTTPEERKIKMAQLRHVGKVEKVLFPLAASATPLVGMFCLGNLMREAGVVERLSKTAQNELINIVTIFLGLGVGSKLETLGILALGAAAFSIGTGAGVLMAKLLNKFSEEDINPLIGAAGVSAVPMAARVVNKVGLEANPQNFLLMHAMGPNRCEMSVKLCHHN